MENDPKFLASMKTDRSFIDERKIVLQRIEIVIGFACFGDFHRRTGSHKAFSETVCPANNKPLPRTALEPVCVALANVIRQRRESSGLSLYGLAEHTSLSRQLISFIETNRRIPTIDSVARISRAFGIPFSKLVAEAEQHLG